MQPIERFRLAMRTSPRAQAALVLLVAAIVYWPLLGSSGLAQSEGHRAIPGWEMLGTGEWLVTHMFEQPYLRKPPGVPWLIAISSWIFGMNEWGARIPAALAATIAPLVSLFFAARWFGRRDAVWAGLAHALTPLFWAPGRSAEIESPHNLAVQIAVLAIIDRLVAHRRDRPSLKWGWFATIAAAVAAMLLTKGPAGVPCLFAAAIAACIALGRWRPVGSPLWRPAFWLPVVTGAAVFGFVAALIAMQVAARDLHPVTQSPGAFLYNPEKLLRIPLLPISTLGSALPLSIAVLFAFRAVGDPHRQRIARSIALTSLIAMLIYMVMGIGNNRYAMPALTVLAPLVAWGPAAWPMLSRKRNQLVAVWYPSLTAILLVGAVVFIGYSENRRANRVSGKTSGQELGAIFDSDATIWANQLVEARPEVLWYAREEAERRGIALRVLWMPEISSRPANRAPGDPKVIAGPMPLDPRVWAALRDDDLEFSEVRALGMEDRVPVFTGQAHKFGYRIYAPLGDLGPSAGVSGQ